MSEQDTNGGEGRRKRGAARRKATAEDAKIVSDEATPSPETSAPESAEAPRAEESAPPAPKADESPTPPREAATESAPSADAAPSDARPDDTAIKTAARVAAARGRARAARADKDAETLAASADAAQTGAAQPDTAQTDANRADAPREADQETTKTPLLAALSPALKEPMVYALGGAVVGGLIVLLGGALFGGGDSAGPEMAALEDRIVALESAPQPSAGESDALAALEDRLNELAEKAETAGGQAEAATANAVAALDRTDELRDGLTALSGHVDTVSRGLAAVVEAAPAGDDGAPAAAATAYLGERIDTVEGGLASLADEIAALRQADEQLADADARLADAIDENTLAISEQGVAIAAQQMTGPSLRAALSALEAGVDGGGPFADALLSVEAETDAPTPEALSALAETSIPTTVALAARFDDVRRASLRAVSRAETADGDAIDRLGGLIVHRRRDATDGDAPDAVLNRAGVLMGEGRLAEAVAEIRSMPEPALSYTLRAPDMAEWLQDAERRLAAEAALAEYRATLLGVGGE